MAMTLAAQIENYIKRLLALSTDNSVELSRADLAQMFMCVPSQINYVLSTRGLFKPGWTAGLIWPGCWRRPRISLSAGRRRKIC